MPGPVVLDRERDAAAAPLDPEPHGRPGRRVDERVARQRPRDLLHALLVGERPGVVVDVEQRACGPRRRRGRRSPPRRPGARPRRARPPRCSIRIRPASIRERSSRSVARFVSRSTWLARRREELAPRRSRRDPRRRAARGSPRSRTAASAARATRWRRTPSARCRAGRAGSASGRTSAASWPTSSWSSSTTGSSNAPSAIRSAARCRRPSRRAWSVGDREAEHDARSAARRRVA